MTDYTKSTNFATKDNLSSGNPLKIVKGTEIDTEFNNIATAIATKADLASPTFTGTPTLPTGTIATTQSSGNNTTAIATTAFVQAAIALLYPVGSIYTNASVSTNPGTLLGFGTWTAFGAGRVMIGAGTGGGGTYTAGTTDGSKDAVVVSHTHTASTASAGDHTHSNVNGGTSVLGPYGSYFGQTSAEEGGGGPNNYLNSMQTAGAHTHTLTVDSAGSSGTNANLPPYIVVYMWQRTA